MGPPAAARAAKSPNKLPWQQRWLASANPWSSPAPLGSSVEEEARLSGDFASGRAVRYIKDLGMALEVGDVQEEEAGLHPGSALYRQMFSAMEANRDGGVYLQGLIIVVERLNGVRK